MAPATIRLGTASPATRATTAATLAELERLARRAAAKQIDILLLPEAYIGGYPRGTHFGCVVGSRSPEGREEYLRYFGSAVDLGDTVGDGAGAGPAWVNRELPSDVVPAPGGEASPVPGRRRGDGTRERLERIARDTGVFLVTGLIEKAGGSLYCSAVYVCPKLGIIGKRRKVMPTGAERLVWAQGSPATLRAVSTSIRGVRVNLGAVICWENYMPLVRQALYAQNVNLYLAPTADGRDAWLSLLRTAAIEGRCFVVSANMCVRAPAAAAAAAVHDGFVEDNDDNDDDDDDDADSDPAPLSPHTRTRRRSSCVTEDGFEIALPKAASSTATATSTATSTAAPQRRRSVFDEDGNEIVLCGGGGGGGSKQQGAKAAATTPAMAATPMSTTTKTKTKTKTKPAREGSGTGFISRGGSAIVSPFGDVLAGPQWEDDEGIIYADVDFADCIRGRLDLDAAGSYSRNDSFKFSVEGLDLTPLPY